MSISFAIGLSLILAKNIFIAYLGKGQLKSGQGTFDVFEKLRKLKGADRLVFEDVEGIVVGYVNDPISSSAYLMGDNVLFV